MLQNALKCNISKENVTVGAARSFGRPFSCVAIDLRSVVFRDVDCRFTVCVFCLRGLVPRPSGPAGVKSSFDRAGSYVPVSARVWGY